MISMAKYIHRNSGLSLNQFNRIEEGDNDREGIRIILSSSFFSFFNSDAYTLRKKRYNICDYNCA